MNRKLLLGQTILMYIQQLPFYVMLILIKTTEMDVSYFLLAGLILFGVVSLYCLIADILYLINGVNIEEDTSKYVMIHKLIQIPWYIFNLVVGVCLIAGFLNPFLMIAIPLIIAILVVTTYTYTLSSSLPNIITQIRLMIKERKANPLGIVTSVLQFFFVADTVASIILYVKNRKQK